MKKRISAKNLPVKSPLHLLITTYLFLEHINANPYVYGAFYALFVLLVVSWIICLYTNEYVDIFEEK
jgi:hypothetical protein